MALSRAKRNSVQVASLRQILPTRRLFTVDEYHTLADIGVLTEDDRVELIDGEILQMPPIGPEHVGNVNWFTNAFSRHFGERAQVSIQNPVRLGLRVEPQPDVAVLKPRPDYYRAELPTPNDVLVLIEIAQSSLEYDRKTKARLYARAGIMEYWIVNLVDREVIVHRDPLRARYRSVQTLRHGNTVAPLAFPDIVISVSDILGTES
jgi:Uma2 family endonuclease